VTPIVTLPPFQTILDEHAPALARFTRALVGAAEAEDVFQDTVLAALRAYPSLRHADNLRGWLFTIAARKAVDRGRRRARVPVETALVPGSDRDPVAPDPPTVSAIDGDEELWAAVRRLPDRQRACVAARFVLDLPYREVADLVGCSEAAARQNVREALRKLREEFDDG
jgi:RNA polymerase sigma factor (sigma-70 family)